MCVIRDMLVRLSSSIDGLSLPNSSLPVSHKREWQDEVLDTGAQGTLEEALGKPRVKAGSQRVSHVFSHIEVPTQVTASHFQQLEPLLQFRPPLNDSSGYINHQSPASVNYLNQSLSSSIVGISQHNRHMSSQGGSWLSSTADSNNPVSFFTYNNPPTRSPTQTPTLGLTQTQTMASNVPLSTGTAFSNSGVQVMLSEAQSRVARWHDNSASLISSFEYSDWVDGGWTGGASQFDHEHPMTESQLRQDQTHIGSQALLHPQPQRQQLALPALQPFVPTHPQPQQFQPQRAPPLPAQTRREEQAQPPTGFMSPLLDPRQHQPQQPRPPPHQQQQPAFNQDNMHTWTSVPTMTSECVFFSSLYFSLPSLLVPTG